MSPAAVESPHEKGPCFTHEFPLAVDEATRRALTLRFRAAANLYNAVLQEMLARLAAMRGDPAWDAARKTPRGKQRSALFRECRRQHGFGKAEAEAFARTVRDRCWIKDHLGGHDTQTTAARALLAVEAYALGQRGRPRFKPATRFRSIASKDDRNFLRLVRTGRDRFAMEYRELLMNVWRRTLSDFDRHALACPIRTLRIVRRADTAKDRFAVQIVVSGTPLQARETQPGVVGIDVGPSTVAIVGEADAALEQLCPSVIQPWRDLRRMERAMDRSRRATNPDAFDDKGRYRRGRKIAVRSRRYKKLARKRARREAALAARRKNEHRQLANRILGAGTTVHAEDLSYRSFQSAFGRSTKVRAAGTFISILARKAESAGGGMILLDTRKTRLSQLDHSTGDFERKPLSLRSHALRDGSGFVQRDLYSAFLARCCDSGTGEFDASTAASAWTGACTLLRMASPTAKPAKQAAGLPLPARRAFTPVEPVVRKARTTRPKAEASRRGQGGKGSGRRSERAVSRRDLGRESKVSLFNPRNFWNVQQARAREVEA